MAAALLAGEVDLALLPIENTSAGSINEVYSLLREHDLFIVGEETWKVDYCLAAVRDVPLSSLNRILSPPEGLEQCARFLQSVPPGHPDQLFRHCRANGRGGRRRRSERGGDRVRPRPPRLRA